jgi:hypothetical protein
MSNEAIGPYEGDIWFAREDSRYVVIKDDEEVGYMGFTWGGVYVNKTVGKIRRVYHMSSGVASDGHDFTSISDREKHLSMAARCLDHHLRHLP